MGFLGTYGYILSIFGIVFLGLAILLSLFVIIPASYWLFSSLSSNRGPAVFRRLFAMLVIILVSSSYLNSPTFYGMAQWRKTTLICSFIIGIVIPVLRIDLLSLDRSLDRVLAMLAGLWWLMLVISEALLVSGVQGQSVLLYLFIAVTGILCGAILGTTAARIAKQKLVQSKPEAGSL
jgi:peptidoglycan/LPS O-acetylase OafA/YrhL